MARAGALRRPPLTTAGGVRAAHDRAGQPVPEAPEDEVHRPRTSAGTRNDLGRVRRRCSTPIPNVVLELGAVLYDLGRQPRAAHDFFVKYQDRILFGKDTYEPEEYPVLLARVRDQGRVFRLLPRLSRVLEDIRHGPARRRAPKDLLRERAARDARTTANR